MSKIKITLRNVEQEFKRLNAASVSVISKGVEAETASLKSALAADTPIDTGKARSSWSYRRLSDQRFEIMNSTPYIQRLNEGSSRQAPKYFIERRALQYGRPLGMITQVID